MGETLVSISPPVASQLEGPPVKAPLLMGNRPSLSRNDSMANSFKNVFFRSNPDHREIMRDSAYDISRLT
jgi:hypothetical protein